jgi:guanylate kinase
MENKIGILIVITGASGAGKDSVMDGVLGNPQIQKLNLKRIVTCADRSPRPGEIDGVQYHFITREKLQEMSKNEELVEPIMHTGSSGKATSKSEIERLLNGENLVWRIEPCRAADVASGSFYKRLFPENAESLQAHTIVLSIVAPRLEVEARRKSRDQDKYDPAEYETRDAQERPDLEILEKYAIPIQNLEGKLDEAIDTAVKSVLKFITIPNF